MLSLYKVLGDTNYDKYSTHADYYHLLQDMTRDYSIELVYNLSSYQGTEAKKHYLEGQQDTIECIKYNIRDKIIRQLIYIYTPPIDAGEKYKDPKYADYSKYAKYAKYSNPNHTYYEYHIKYQEYLKNKDLLNKKKRVPIIVREDRLPTMDDLEKYEAINEKNEYNGHIGISDDAYMLYRYILIHLHRIYEIEHYLTHTIGCISRGERYSPPPTQSQTTKRLEIEIMIEDKYPNGIMTRKEVIDLLQINPSTMTDYTNRGEIVPIDPTSRVHTYYTSAVIDLYKRRGMGHSRKAKK